MKDDKIPQRGQPARTPLPTKPNAPHRILVVDEDADLCRLYSTVLAQPGCHVYVAQSGEAAWQALQANQYTAF
jgi:CheY-like chemotaxis protein